MNEDRKGDIVKSIKVHGGKRRTYFIDIKKTRNEDYFISLTENARLPNGEFEKHVIYLYKEDFNRFLDGLDEMIHHIQTVLMPDVDFEKFDRRQEEWEARRKEEQAKQGVEDGEGVPET